MSDLKDFTPMSEEISPDETIRILNRYFSWMIDIVYRHKGIIVDFYGDALLVFFDPIDGPIAPAVLRAVECAIEMQNGMDSFNAQNISNGLPELQMRIAVNSGEVIVGNIGSDTRAKYGIVGAPVNLTDRIQNVANGGEVVISESAYRHGNGQILTERMMGVKLKGIHEPVNVYVVKALRM